MNRFVYTEQATISGFDLGLGGLDLEGCGLMAWPWHTLIDSQI